MGLRKNKKGSLQDLVFIGAILLTMSIAILLGFKITNEVNSKIQDNAILGGMAGADDAKNAMNNINNLYSGVIDNSFLLLTMGLAVIALILAMLVRVHPVFFVFYIILLTIIIFLSGVFSNIYTKMAESTAMADVATQLIFTSHIMAYLPFLIGVVGFIIAIVMYKNYEAAQ